MYTTKIVNRFIIMVICCLFLINIAQASDFFYRADTRAPDEIKRSRGLLPKGESDYFERGTKMNINLYDHAVGMTTGSARYDDGYVSTTRTRDHAHEIGQMLLSGVNTYYIYVIAAAPNLISVNDVLRQHSPHPEEMEYSAIGGIPLTQIYGWYRVQFGRIDDRGLRRNPAYREDLFRGMTVSSASDAYALAGFPAGHEAWRQEPWVNFAPPGCQGNRNRMNGGNSQCGGGSRQAGEKVLDKYKKKISSSITYYRLDSRRPDEIISTSGFNPSGQDLNVLNHALDEHPSVATSENASGYISFTDEQHLNHMVSEFYGTGVRESWLYTVDVEGQGLPSLSGGLNQTFAHVLSVLRALDSNFPVLTPETASEQLQTLNEQYSENEEVLSLLAELASVITAHEVSVYLGDHLSRFIPASAISSALRVSLNADGSYGVIERRDFPYSYMAPAESFSSTATNGSVDLTPLTLSERARLMALPGLGFCGVGGTSPRSANDNKACPRYLKQVVISSGYRAKISFLGESSVNGVRFGQMLQSWVYEKKRQKYTHCSVFYDAENSKKSFQCFHGGEKNDFSSVTKINGNFSDAGWTDGGQSWVDVNGDGYADYCRLVYLWTKIQCDLSDGTQLASQITSKYLDGGYPYERWWADVNGDGKTDFCRITSSGMECALGSDFSTTWRFSDNDYGWADSRAFADIEGKGRQSYCRLVYGWTHIRCNVPQKDGSWKRYESEYQDGGYPGYRYWVRYNGAPGYSFCRVTGGGMDYMTCTSFVNGKFISPVSFKLPAIPAASGNIMFADLGGRGVMDICVLGVGGKLSCSLNNGKAGFSAPFSPGNSTVKGFGNFATAEQAVFSRSGKYADYCRNVGYSTLRCMHILVEPMK